MNIREGNGHTGWVDEDGIDHMGYWEHCDWLARDGYLAEMDWDWAWGPQA